MNQLTDNDIAQIAQLFAGYERAHGRYEVKRVNDKGKNEGRATTHREPPTIQLWQGHLAGTGAGLGIIPLRSDDTLFWGCIDIDTYPLDHSKLEQRIKDMKLPLVMCRSKSGGAHCFLFFSEPVEAGLAVAKLNSIAAALGYGGAEVFPKQITRLDEVQDIGNWLNMPYYYAERTTRYGIRDGQPLTLPEFLAFAHDARITLKQLKEELPVEAPNDPDGLFADGPPCLQHLAEHGGFPEGTRNEGLYNAAVYLKKRFGDDFGSKLSEYNSKLCTPALPSSDVLAIEKSVAKKDYRYKCGKPPIHAHCNASVCALREYGIDDNYPNLALTKLADVDLWLLDLDGTRIMLNTRELTTQKLYQEKVAQAIRDLPRTMPQNEWEKKIGNAMRRSYVQEIGEDEKAIGQFKIAFHSYIMGLARTNTREQLLESNAPYNTGEGEVWFKRQGLLNHMQRHGYKYDSPMQVGQLLRGIGCEPFLQRVATGKDPVRLWKYKVEQSQVPDDPVIKFGTEEF